jgi:hypothetical protein
MFVVILLAGRLFKLLLPNQQAQNNANPCNTQQGFSRNGPITKEHLD